MDGVGAADTSHMSLPKTSALMVAVFVILLAPAAHAQGLPGGGVGDLPGGVTDAVGGTTGGVTGTVGGTTSGVTETVGDTTGGVTDTVDGTTGGVTDAVGGTTGGVTDTVGDTTGGVTDTVDETTSGDAVEETTGGVTKTVEQVAGGNGNGGNNPVHETVTGLTGRGTDSNPSSDQGAQQGMSSPAGARGWIDGTKVMDDFKFASPLNAVSSLAAMLEGAIRDLTAIGSVSGAPGWAAGEPEGESFFAVAGRAAEKAAKALAFPLALAVIVAGFLMAQGRIGRKDPKLVLAPIDASSETLSFE